MCFKNLLPPLRVSAIAALALGFPWLSAIAAPQDALKSMPGYKDYARALLERTNVFKSGALNVKWVDDGKALEYRHDGKRWLYDIAARHGAEAQSTNAAPGTNRARAPRSLQNEMPARPARGRQYDAAISPNLKYRAFYRERNLWLRELSSTNETAITTEGNEPDRIKLGTATWTYGEELDQTTAIWWSSNNQKVAFYRFDESRVPDYYLTLGHTSIQNRLDVEPYPKAGGANPVVDLLVYDLDTRKTVQVDARDGREFADDVLGHYVYNIGWSPGGLELLFHRTNRRQNIMELCAANPETGLCRVILREEWAPSWVENSPVRQFLKDGKRFIWASERTGWKNFYLYDVTGRQIAQLTGHEFEVANIVRVDEERGHLYYMARSGDNPMKLQLHRVGLDGAGDVRLTDPAFHHSIDLSPDCAHFVDVQQKHDHAPFSVLKAVDGRQIACLAESDLSRFQKLRMRKVELFEFRAADGQTPLYGMLHFPSRFTPRKKYPLLVDVYAGPATPGARETFTLPSILTELGFLYATLDSRSASGRGKRFLDSIYQQLGKVEIDDQAHGVQALGRRRYVDSSRVGVFGTSYGGTASGLCLLRYPNVFHAACASSAVTDFRNYDTIYTERYFGLPQAAPEAYDQVKLMTYAKSLRRPLMIFYGTADDNVHPSNALQLIKALQDAKKSFEVQVGSDQGHTSLNRERMMEFFIHNLVMKKPARLE